MCQNLLVYTCCTDRSANRCQRAGPRATGARCHEGCTQAPVHAHAQMCNLAVVQACVCTRMFACMCAYVCIRVCACALTQMVHAYSSCSASAACVRYCTRTYAQVSLCCKDHVFTGRCPYTRACMHSMSLHACVCACMRPCMCPYESGCAYPCRQSWVCVPPCPHEPPHGARAHAHMYANTHVPKARMQACNSAHISRMSPPRPPKRAVLTVVALCPTPSRRARNIRAQPPTACSSAHGLVSLLRLLHIPASQASLSSSFDTCCSPRALIGCVIPLWRGLPVPASGSDHAKGNPQS